MSEPARSVPGVLLQGALGLVKKKGCSTRFFLLSKHSLDWFSSEDAAIQNLEQPRRIRLADVENIEVSDSTITLTLEDQTVVGLVMLPGQEAQVDIWSRNLKKAVEKSKKAPPPKQPPQDSARPHAQPALEPGDRVIANGQKGKLLNLDTSTGTWNVQMKNGSVSNIAPELLSLRERKTDKASSHETESIATASSVTTPRPEQPTSAQHQPKQQHPKQQQNQPKQPKQQEPTEQQPRQHQLEDHSSKQPQQNTRLRSPRQKAIVEAGYSGTDEDLKEGTLQNPSVYSTDVGSEVGEGFTRLNTLEQWTKSTEKKLAMVKQVKQNLKNHREKIGKTVTISGSTHQEEQMKLRLAREKQISESLKVQLQTLEEARYRLTDALTRLRKASTFSAFSVVEKRREIRNQRPACELCEDACNQAMEQERNYLLGAKEELNKQIEALEKKEQACDAVKADMCNKRLSLHLDRTNYPDKLLERARSLSASSNKVVADADAVLERRERDAKKFRDSSTAALKRHMTETLEFKKKLEVELQACSLSIQEGEKRLSNLSHRLKLMKVDPETCVLAPEEEERIRKLNGSNAAQHALITKIRAKVRAAAYSGPHGMSLTDLFKRLKKHSLDEDDADDLELDEDELHAAMRKTCKISHSAMSDGEIATFIKRIDVDNSGKVSVNEVVEMLDADKYDMAARWRDLKKELDKMRDMQTNLQADLRAKVATWRVDDCCQAVSLNATGSYEEKYDVAQHRICNIDMSAFESHGSPSSSKAMSPRPLSPGQAAAPQSPDQAAPTSPGEMSHSGESLPSFDALTSPRTRTRKGIAESKKHRETLHLMLDRCMRDDDNEALPHDGTPLPGTTHAVERLKNKQHRQEHVQSTLKSRIDAMQESLFKVNDLHVKVQKASVWNEIALTQRRIQIREGRALSEQANDRYQVALGREMQVLSHAASEYEKIIDDIQHTIPKMQKWQQQMHSQKLTLHLDRSEKPEELLCRMQKLVESANEFVAKSEATISIEEAAVERVKVKTGMDLKQHLEYTHEIRRQLEEEIKDNAREIAQAKKHVAKLQFDLDHNARKTGAIDEELHDSEAPGRLRSLPNGEHPQLKGIRSKIKAALYTGPNGRQVEESFRRMDKDGSGALDKDEFRQVLRKAFKIPPSVVSDPEILVLGQMLDTDRSGTVNIDEIMDFIQYIDPVALKENIKHVENQLAKLEAAQEEMVNDLKNKVHTFHLDEKCRLLVNVAAQLRPHGSRPNSPTVFSPVPRSPAPGASLE